MRLLLLHNRIYRAFPELDRYSDERCRKFMRVAQRGWMRRVFHATIVLLAAGLALFAGVAATGWIAETWFQGMAARSSILFDLCLVLLGVCLSPVAGYVTRDLLLRWRIRHVLRARGTCFRCRYSLIGLPVGPGHTVTCPECAQETEVDPALGELVLDDAGLARFQPPPPKLPLIFTPARLRTLKRIAIVLALILGVGVPAILGGYELWLRHQATIAATEKPGAQALIALVEANQPPGSAGEANAWEILQDVLTLKEQIEIADAANNPSLQGDRVWPDFARICAPTNSNPDQTDEEAAYAAESEAVARRLLDAYRLEGVYALMGRMALAPRAARAGGMYKRGGTLGEANLYDLGKMRGLARVNSARMRLAGERGDLAEYISALEATFALSRIAAHEPLLIDGLTSVALESMCYFRLHELLRSHPGPEWLDAIDAAIARQRVDLPREFPWEGERLVARDGIAWWFADPDRVRRGRFSAQVKHIASGDPTRRLGTYAQNRDAIDAWYDQASKRAALPHWRRPSDAEQPEVETDLFLAKMMMSAREHVQMSFDQIEMQRGAYTIAAALERYYASKGAYPDSLAALVPSYLPAPPIDPWTGKPWGYRRRAPDAPAADPRPYVLYSFGEDRIDNGGSPTPGYPNPKALTSAGAGADFIINEWQPRE